MVARCVVLGYVILCILGGVYDIFSYCSFTKHLVMGANDSNHHYIISRGAGIYIETVLMPAIGLCFYFYSGGSKCCCPCCSTVCLGVVFFFLLLVHLSEKAYDIRWWYRFYKTIQETMNHQQPGLGFTFHDAVKWTNQFVSGSQFYFYLIWFELFYIIVTFVCVTILTAKECNNPNDSGNSNANQANQAPPNNNNYNATAPPQKEEAQEEV